MHLGERDLRLALPAARVLGEDVEDQPGAVDDLDLDDVLELAQLTRAELTVADHGVGAVLDDHIAQLARLTGADVGRRVGLVAALHEPVDDDRARGLGQPRELLEAALGVVQRALGPDADQHHALEADLTVFDLGDVLELGREPGDTTQRSTIGEIELTGRGVVEVQVEVDQVGVREAEARSARAVPGGRGVRRGRAGGVSHRLDGPTSGGVQPTGILRVRGQAVDGGKASVCAAVSSSSSSRRSSWERTSYAGATRRSVSASASARAVARWPALSNGSSKP